MFWESGAGQSEAPFFSADQSARGAAPPRIRHREKRPSTDMPSLTLQKRLAASTLKCGARKVWLDPAESADISRASSRRAARVPVW